MPLTISHPIATAPIWHASGRKLDLSALVIGSMSPDIPYFIHLHPVYAPGHSLTGIFIYCLPSSLVLFFLWKTVIRIPIFNLLGTETQTLETATGFSISYLLQLVIAIVIGALTHVLWDASSHDNGWFVLHLSWLRQTVFGLPFYKWNQYAGGILGLLGIIFWWFQQNHSIKHKSQKVSIIRNLRLFAWVSFFTCTIFFAIIAIFIKNTGGIGAGALIRGVIGSISGAAVWSLIFAIIYWIHSFRRF